ncbi:MAG: HAMP domain-containing histidine kinase [Candidatus Eisenbacteria bacterium]|uniref:histidine kinase n=1 Tax=Eiseniibacteriota bacterium TaxID=2212470 RepID=A0A948W5X4_UNCEI|nr:HAMP domain-containing histidine kinase [Candidatus Eisenbacteria bacterium]MBU1950982.1 HAMP domain-containing histidine kinase [Candidatus Eisenbacteria bacterium]MBU2690909.1 HAMP domain-containing histidine kinase [Candidatus Eisenbacteria bacterium]
MTLKLRLATMMVIILIAVMVLQYLLMQREQHVLLARLSELSSGLDQTTLVFAQRVHELARNRELPNLDAIVEEFICDAAFQAADSVAQVKILAWVADDTLGTSRKILRRDRFIKSDEKNRRLLWVPGPVCDSLALGKKGDWGSPRTLIVKLDTLGFSHGDSSATAAPALSSPQTAGGGKGGHDIIINLPLNVSDSDSAFYSLQYRYPLNHLTEDLGRARWRGLYWLVSILGLGILGAFLVAAQFTRPIKALQSSFGRVVDGDLDQLITPKRSDEIGRLTGSFNEMVGRLKESQQVEKRLAEAERLAAVGRLAAGVAHEIRNPLNTILLTMQHMRDKVIEAGGVQDRPGAGGGEPKEFGRYYNLVTSEISRLEKMVGAFLDFSRSGELQLESVNVSESLRSSVALFSSEAEALGISLSLECADGIEIEADPGRLPMIWNNLLSNALEATPKGKKIFVQAGIEKDHLVISVIDEGSGISQEELLHIWDPFYSGRSGGVGLGLSIVRSVAEHHSGWVRADSETGRGTRMTVTLPARQERHPAVNDVHPLIEGEPDS